MATASEYITTIPQATPLVLRRATLAPPKASNTLSAGNKRPSPGPQQHVHRGEETLHRGAKIFTAVKTFFTAVFWPVKNFFTAVKNSFTAVNLLSETSRRAPDRDREPPRGHAGPDRDRDREPPRGHAGPSAGALRTRPAATPPPPRLHPRGPPYHRKTHLL